MQKKFDATDREILRLALPSIVSNITVPLLGLVDLAIAGHLGSARYIAAIAVGTMIFNMIYWLMGFLRMGTSGLTSQAFGARDFAGIRSLLHRSLLTALTIALALLLLQWPVREFAMWLMGPSPEVRQLASAYFNIVIWGAPAMLSLYSLTGWFVGMQTTRLPMVVAIVQNVVNIIASLTFVFGMGMKIEGIALGTLVAQWSGVVMSGVMARRLLRRTKQELCDAGSAKSSLHRRPSLFSVNRNIFLRTLCLVAVSVAFTSVGARQGDMVLAVNTLLMTFYTLFSYIMDGYAFAGEALTGKSYGAGDREGLLRVVNHLLLRWGLPLALMFTALYVVGGHGLVMLLTDDPAVISASAAYQPWVWLIPLAGFGAFVYDGIFIGLTATRGMLLSAFLSALGFFLIVAVAALLSRAFHDFSAFNHLLWLAFIVYLAMRGAVEHFLYRKRLFIAQKLEN